MIYINTFNLKQNVIKNIAHLNVTQKFSLSKLIFYKQSLKWILEFVVRIGLSQFFNKFVL